MLSLLPKKSWLRDYVEWSGENESPKKYHLFVGLVVLASVLARRVFFARMDRVYPNLYIVFVSPPGTGKSTASDIGESLLRRLNPGVRPRLKSGKVTPEAFRNWLSRREFIAEHPALDGAIGTIFADELSVFLGKQKYNEGMVSMLTKLYGCPETYEEETIQWGNIRLKNVCVSLIGTTVDDALVKTVNENAILGGFVSRVLWVVGEDEGLRVPFPRPLDDRAAQRLADHLVGLTNLRGEITLDESARGYYEEWYRQQGRSHPTIAGFYERKPTHALKLAILLQAADYTRRGRIVSKVHVETAGRILDLLEPDAEQVVTAIQTGLSGRRIDQLYAFIKAKTPCPYSEIVNFLYPTSKSLHEIDNALDILTARGLIKIKPSTGTAVVYEAINA